MNLILLALVLTSARADMLPMPAIRDFAIPEAGITAGQLYGTLPGKETKTGEDKENTYFERRVRNDEETSLLICKRAESKTAVLFPGHRRYASVYTCRLAIGEGGMLVPADYTPKSR